MKYLSILFVIAFLGCKANQQVKDKSSQHKDWTIASEKKYQDNVDIKIVNNTESNLVVFDPFLKNIEKFDGENWRKINNPYCPCGSCPPPPETMTILSKGKHIFNWDKSIVSCQNGKKIALNADSGRYRVTFNYGKSLNVKSFEKLVVEFEI